MFCLEQNGAEHLGFKALHLRNVGTCRDSGTGSSNRPNRFIYISYGYRTLLKIPTISDYFLLIHKEPAEKQKTGTVTAPAFRKIAEISLFLSKVVERHRRDVVHRTTVAVFIEHVRRHIDHGVARRLLLNRLSAAEQPT